MIGWRSIEWVQPSAQSLLQKTIEVSSNIPGTTAISVLIEKNPFPMTGRFSFKEGALPFVKLNVKMGETSEVRVVAEAGGRSYMASREIKVTIGGCGG